MKKSSRNKLNRRFYEKLADYDLGLPESKKQYNQKLFSPVSQVYANITGKLSFGRDKHWKKKLVSLLPEFDYTSILDIACGPGDLTFLLADKYENADITGIDLNPDMLEEARHNLEGTTCTVRERIHFAQGDMGRLGYSRPSFDLVTGGYALRNAPDLEQTLKEIHRVLLPAGVAAFLDFSRSSGKIRSALQTALLSFWGKLWGRIYHRNPEVYGYIAESLKHFPDNKSFCALLEQSGFAIIEHIPRFAGLMHLTVVRKTS